MGYARELDEGDSIVMEQSVEIESDGTIELTGPIQCRITLIHKTGRRARLSIECSDTVSLEHVPHKAGSVLRKKARPRDT